jgi:hypothetical protein
MIVTVRPHLDRYHHFYKPDAILPFFITKETIKLGETFDKKTPRAPGLDEGIGGGRLGSFDSEPNFFRMTELIVK